MKTIYQVKVTREDNTWLAEVTNLPTTVTEGRNLQILDKNIKEAIECALELRDIETQDWDVEYHYETDDLIKAAKLGDQRSSLLEETQRKAKQLNEAGYSVRDISHLLQITPGRVSQLTSK